jgi:hypothetical protein
MKDSVLTDPVNAEPSAQPREPLRVRKRMVIALLLVLLGAGYFILFLAPNSTGAQDRNMISIFSADEFAQYPHVSRMLEPGNTVAQSVYRFFAYQHYYYGFPFYFISAAVALFPVKLLHVGSTVSLNMLLLRQVVSVLPMVLGLTVLVFLQTGFDSYVKSIGLFMLLLSVPEVVANDLWWHPESLVFLFVVLTFFFLARDKLKLGPCFYVSAITCGLAVATKLVGLFFFLTIPIYVFLAWRARTISMHKALLACLGFLGILAAVFVLSNPFLYWASERSQALKIQTRQAAAMSSGFVLAYGNSPWSWLSVIEEFYGLPAFLLLAISALVISVSKGQSRLLNVLIATWSVPFAAYLFTAIIIRPKHFFLPILLPVFSALPAYFAYVAPSWNVRPFRVWLKANGGRSLLFLAGVLVLGWQVVYNLRCDLSLYEDTLHRELNSPALQFYTRLNQDYLPHMVLNRQLVIYRDVQMYVPESPAYDVKFQWGTIDYDYLRKTKPDLLILNKQRLHDFTQPGAQGRALDPDFAQAYRFYRDALDAKLTGYTLLYQDETGMAFLGTGLHNEFFR